MHLGSTISKKCWKRPGYVSTSYLGRAATRKRGSDMIAQPQTQAIQERNRKKEQKRRSTSHSEARTERKGCGLLVAHLILGLELKVRVEAGAPWPLSSKSKSRLTSTSRWVGFPDASLVHPRILWILWCVACINGEHHIRFQSISTVCLDCSRSVGDFVIHQQTLMEFDAENTHAACW